MNFEPVFFAGGLTCLDFCNTVDHLNFPPQYDFFTDNATLLDWGRAAGILPRHETIPTSDPATFQKALETRDLLIRLLTPFSRAATPAAADLAAFNIRYQEASAYLRLQLDPETNGYALTLETPDPLERVTHAAVRSAADLLLHQELERVRQCSECGWLFYDTTRNRSRRWCDMGTCGNRAKARRHYERVRQEKVG